MNKKIVIVLIGILTLFVVIYTFNKDKQEAVTKKVDGVQFNPLEGVSSQKIEVDNFTSNDLVNEKTSQPRSDHAALVSKDGEDGEDEKVWYSDELDILLKEKNLEKRKEFIKEKTKTLTPESFYEIIKEYQNNPDERSARRIISRAILSEIENDVLLDIFYKEVTFDQSLLPDFVSATYYTNSQNSFNKLMEIQKLNYDKKTMEDLKRGVLMMYQGNITSELISHMETWLSNRNHLSNQQESIIIKLLTQAPTNKAEPVVRSNIFKFSSTGQETLKNHFDSSPRRE